MNDSNLKAAVLELRNVFAQHLPTEDVAGVLRKAVERALLEVLGNAPKRRGRPPKNATASSAPAAPAAAKATPKKKGRSPASRAKQAAKMRAYWAARKATEGGGKATSKKKRGRPAKAKVADAPVA